MNKFFLETFHIIIEESRKKKNKTPDYKIENYDLDIDLTRNEFLNKRISHSDNLKVNFE